MCACVCAHARMCLLGLIKRVSLTLPRWISNVTKMHKCWSTSLSILSCVHCGWDDKGLACQSAQPAQRVVVSAGEIVCPGASLIQWWLGKGVVAGKYTRCLTPPKGSCWGMFNTVSQRLPVDRAPAAPTVTCSLTHTLCWLLSLPCPLSHASTTASQV